MLCRSMLIPLSSCFEQLGSGKIDHGYGAPYFYVTNEVTPILSPPDYSYNAILHV